MAVDAALATAANNFRIPSGANSNERSSKNTSLPADGFPIDLRSKPVMVQIDQGSEDGTNATGKASRERVHAHALAKLKQITPHDADRWRRGNARGNNHPHGGPYMGIIDRLVKSSRTIAYIALATLALATVPTAAQAQTWTPATLTAPVQIIDVAGATTTVMTYVGGILVILMAMFLAFCAVGLIWRFFGRVTRSGKA